MAERRSGARFARMLRRAWGCLADGGWRAVLCRAVVVLALLGAGALAFVGAGGVPVAASEGHWGLTRVLLQFAMRSSVRTRTLGQEAPPLDDPALVLKGAGHYAAGCLPCHGAPGRGRALVVRQMTPEPPYLPAGLVGLRDEELFWIVRHGIKYTAMPAWSAQVREDEVWAMVAYLRAQVDMDADTFRRLAYGPADGAPAPDTDARLASLGAAPSPVLADCTRCHGADGEGRGDGAYPRLAGLDEAYLFASLQAFARGHRHSGIMQPVAVGLSPAQMRSLARHFAARHDVPAEERCEDPAAFARGAALARDGDAGRRIPACAACHEEAGNARNPLYPALDGQHRDYLALQLALFRDGRRGGTAYAGLMRAAAGTLEDRDIHDLATYYAAGPAGCTSR